MSILDGVNKKEMKALLGDYDIKDDGTVIIYSHYSDIYCSHPLGYYKWLRSGSEEEKLLKRGQKIKTVSKRAMFYLSLYKLKKRLLGKNTNAT